MVEKPKLEIVTPEPSDALDLSDLWLDPALGDGLTDTVLHSVPVDKPKDFFRVHPDKTWRRRTEVYTHKPEGQIEVQQYIVAAPMRGKIEEARPATVVPCIYRDGSVRLWVLKFPKPGEKENDAWLSARNAAREAMSRWIRLVWVRRVYEWREAQPGYAPDPDWSKLPPFDTLIELGFGSTNIIRDEQHVMYRDLMGAAPTKSAPKAVGDDDADDL